MILKMPGTILNSILSLLHFSIICLIRRPEADGIAIKAISTKNFFITRPISFIEPSVLYVLYGFKEVLSSIKPTIL